ncbi:MAG: MerR family transcriptional regulator [Bacillota bacterium]
MGTDEIKARESLLSDANTQDSEPLFRISMAAMLTGLSTAQIKYYEAHGLLDDNRKVPGKHRYYSKKDIERLIKIKNLREQSWATTAIKLLFNAQ